jgi:hypothetical protein
MPGIVTQDDRLKSGLGKIVRAIFGPRIDYLAPQFAVVKAQNADGSVDILPDDVRFPGLQGVPIDTGIPGVSFTISVGARVQLMFVGGDPSKPRVTEWDSASVTSLTVTSTQVTVVASTILLGSSGATQPFVLGTSYATHCTQLATAATALAAAATSLAAAMTPLLLPPAAAAAATAAAAAATAAGQISAAATLLAGDLSTVTKGQ